MQSISNYIAGELVPPVSGRWLDNIDPATGKAYSLVPDSDAADVDRAIAAAQDAFPRWSAICAENRSHILLRIAELIERDLDALSLAECIDNGKPLSRCRTVDIPRAVQNFRFFATAILHERSDLHVMDRDALNYTLRRPRGVAGLISPWNLPLYLLTWKIAPAIAAGNTAVAKPSEVTPMTAYLLSKLCIEAGLPPGVLNIVHGLGPKVGAPLVADSRVPTISFTGGTKTGQGIAAASAPLFKKVSLEMGGKNPNIVFADSDLDAALNTSVQTAFANQGQICLCGSRLLVEQSIADDFSARFVAKARALRIGDPLDAATDQGALVSRAQLEKSTYYVDVAKQEGGTILCGGAPPKELPARCRGGYFFEPTVIAGLGPACRTNQEEIFGPLVTIIPFRDERQALEIANGTAYGLSASVWTSNLTRAHRIADQLQSGTVWVNCWLLRDLRVPFGGVKQSGVGREGGDEAMRFFTEPKNVCIRT
jgi:aminomuconate-semialdehyde/2-hydroxymuconate-6-semialdehyde dehydrogenase